jgi:Uma2 family endonuclease
MGHVSSTRVRSADEPEPTWEIARLFPAQGTWSEWEYLDLDSNHLVEFSNGCLEFPPMPTTTHQLIVAYLYRLLLAFATAHDLGTVLFAALPVRLWRRKFREPDVVFMRKEHANRIREQYWNGADLVMEVVSGKGKDRRRDLVDKRREYARAGIPEYWIVDPRDERITVLRLARKRYIVHGEFDKGTTATSHLLPGFTVDVSEAFSRQTGRASAPKGRRKPKRPPSA